MVGKKTRPSSLFFFVPGSLEDYIPKDHILRRAHEAVDLSWVTEEVRDAYIPTKGAPSVDPVVVIKLLIIGYLFNFPRTPVKEGQRLISAVVFLCVWRSNSRSAARQGGEFPADHARQGIRAAVSLVKECALECRGE